MLFPHINGLGVEHENREPPWDSPRRFQRQKTVGEKPMKASVLREGSLPVAGFDLKYSDVFLGG